MKNIIDKFYSAFAAQNTEEMISCYHDDVVFEDPAFGKLNREQVCSMWEMLANSQKGKEFIITFSDVTADNEKGSAKWEAKYNFSKTGRFVHNKISAQFEFKDGLIIKHTDDFNLHAWTRQALGFSGLLLGWSGFFKKKLNAQTESTLKKFMDKKNS